MSYSPAEFAAVAKDKFGIDATEEAIACFVAWIKKNANKRTSLRAPADPLKQYKNRPANWRLPPHALLDHIVEKFQLKNDAALSRFLEVAPPVLSKVRSGRLNLGGMMIVRIHEKTSMSIADIKALLPKSED